MLMQIGCQLPDSGCFKQSHHIHHTVKFFLKLVGKDDTLNGVTSQFKKVVIHAYCPDVQEFAPQFSYHGLQRSHRKNKLNFHIRSFGIRFRQCPAINLAIRGKRHGLHHHHRSRHHMFREMFRQIFTEISCHSACLSVGCNV